MNRIEKTIKKNKKSLVSYFMGGQFSHQETLNILHTSVKCGVDMLEIGFPFSDPTADGSTIQNAARESLNNNTTLHDIFKLSEDFRSSNAEIPLILMGYYNIVFNYGLENFAQDCKQSGIDGLIIVDLPIEESLEFEQILQRHNIFLIHIVSFLTNKQRFTEIQQRANGFIYLTSSFGVTGQTEPVIEKIDEYIKQVQPQMPIFVGFGISNSQIAKEVAQNCNGVVVGSHLIKTYKEHGIHTLEKEIIAIKSSITGA